MRPELFHIPFINMPIYGYGVMLVIGFLLAVQLAKYLSRKVGIDPEIFINAGLIALVAGIAGARLSHVIENWPQYSDPARSFWSNFFAAINIRSGGLTFYGGLILAFPITSAYLIWKKVPLRLAMDVAAPCLMIGLGLGRVGCYLNGCCYGAEVSPSYPLAITFPYHSNAYVDEYDAGQIKPPPELTTTLPNYPRPVLLDPQEIQHDPELSALASAQHSLPLQPAQFYSTLNALLIAAVLVCYFSLRPAPGQVMGLMLMMEGISRWLLEILRAEPPITYWFGHGWSFSMVLSLFLLAGGLVLWVTFGLLNRRGDEKGLEPESGTKRELPVPA
jgi:phosphatidylglycerol:prolipoprotein diacylglycerol transferase